MRILSNDYVFNQLDSLNLGDQSREYAEAAENVQDTFIELMQELPEGKKQQILKLQDDVYLMLAESENIRFKQGFATACQLINQSHSSQLRAK